jgi:hypothetical protein
MKSISEKIRFIEDFLYEESDARGFDSAERYKEFLIDLYMSHEFKRNTQNFIGWLIYNLERKIRFNKLKIELSFNEIMYEIDFPSFSNNLYKGSYHGKWGNDWYRFLEEDTKKRLNYRYIKNNKNI